MKKTSRTKTGWLAGVLLCAGVTGCHVGPAYHPPAIQPPPAFKEAPPAAPPADTTQPPNNADNVNWAPAQPADAKIRGDWWAIFNDPELNDLESQLNIDNQNIKLYFENFMESRALVREARAQYFPTVSVGPSYNRQRSSAKSGPDQHHGQSRQDLADLLAAIGCFLDPGPIRQNPPTSAQRAIHRAGQCRGSGERAIVEQADLAEFFFEIRGQDALIQIYTQTVAADQKALDYNQAQYDTGVGDQLSVVEARATLQAAQSSLTNLGILRAQYEHAIAVLIGKAASGFSLPPRPLLTAPPPVPIGMPSLLLQRRPDVAAAERTMAAANAELGVAYTAFFPTLTLSASGGFDSYLFKHLADWPSRFWSVGPSFSQPIFNAALKPELHQYVAIYNADVASYRQTVLTAFQQVEDSLSQTRILSQQIQQQRGAVASSQTALDLEMGRYQTGIDPYLDVVTLQNTVLSNQQQLASLQIEEMTGAVQLVQALGGGWDASQLPTPKQVTAEPSKADTKIQQ